MESLACSFSYKRRVLNDDRRDGIVHAKELYFISDLRARTLLTTPRMFSVISFSCCKTLNLKGESNHTVMSLAQKTSTKLLPFVWLHLIKRFIYMFIWWGPGLFCFSGKLLSTMVRMALYKRQKGFTLKMYDLSTLLLLFHRKTHHLPPVVYDNSHGCCRRQSRQVQIHMFDTRGHFAHTQELVQ